MVTIFLTKSHTPVVEIMEDSLGELKRPNINDKNTKSKIKCVSKIIIMFNGTGYNTWRMVTQYSYACRNYIYSYNLIIWPILQYRLG